MLLHNNPAGAFTAAASCLAVPTAASSKPDSTGRLWGQLKDTRCAFKDATGHALFYTGYEPGSWLHTAACSMPAFSDNSVTDSKLRVSLVAAGQGPGCMGFLTAVRDLLQPNYVCDVLLAVDCCSGLCV
jgi:hypothetical protein